MTTGSEDDTHLRAVVLRAWWDGEDTPSIEVPLGDFFGLGHARTATFWSLPLQMAPEDGRALSCWFPMPFDSARIELSNDSSSDVVCYFYVDYELGGPDVAGLGRFHAQWRRENPARGIDPARVSNEEFISGGSNLDAADNYVILEAHGVGHYVGCNLAIDNRRNPGPDLWDWYGEGDDMIFVDGEPFPPSLHGTGTEDYFGSAWCPTVAYSSPYQGIILPGGPNWQGKVALYRFHIEDPVRFAKSIRVTIEHGHANHRSDDIASTAYWYQAEPHAPFPTLPTVTDRLPHPD